MTIPADTPATVAELRRELAAVKAEHEKCMPQVKVLTEKWAQAQKQIAELEPDAERYRFIRNTDHIDLDYIPSPDALDAAVDAARAKEGK